MKIIITGGGGYIGARLSSFLANKGHKVTVVCFSKIPQQNEWINSMHGVIKGDIREQATLRKIADIKPDAVIHLISLDHHDSEKNPAFVSQVNVQPVWNLLDIFADSGLSKFIYFSTIHVYGKNQRGDIHENQYPTPFNAYGLSHFLCEEICNYYNRKTNIDCMNIRLSNSYGEPIFEDANCWSLIVNDLAKSAFFNKKIILNSDGSAVRDFIHFTDICEGINKLLLINEPGADKTIHFSSSKSVSMLDVAAEVRLVYLKRYKEEIPIYINGNEFYEPSIYLKNETVNNKISNSLAKSYSIEFTKELSDGIEDLFIYFENQECQQ